MSKEGKTSMVTPTGQEIFEATTGTESAAPRDEQKIVGRTPRQLAWMRFRRDKVSMTAMVVVALAVLVGIASPIMETFHWIKPYETHQNLVTGIGSVPTGAFGGASSKHWLGVVPGIGWDLMDRLLAGITLSLVIATSA